MRWERLHKTLYFKFRTKPDKYNQKVHVDVSTNSAEHTCVCTYTKIFILSLGRSFVFDGYLRLGEQIIHLHKLRKYKINYRPFSLSRSFIFTLSSYSLFPSGSCSRQSQCNFPRWLHTRSSTSRLPSQSCCRRCCLLRLPRLQTGRASGCDQHSFAKSSQRTCAIRWRAACPWGQFRGIRMLSVC